MSETRLNKDMKPATTVVTAGDGAYAWGALMLVASMRRNGMRHPVLVWAMDWNEEQKRRICALGGVTVQDIANSIWNYIIILKL